MAEYLFTVTTAYHFKVLTSLPELRMSFLEVCQKLELIGTILIATEGVNLTLAGSEQGIQTFEDWFHQQSGFKSVPFKRSVAEIRPFQRLVVKIKPEIIRMDRPGFVPSEYKAPALPPSIFKEWLDTKKDLMILDVRNDYETVAGHFKGAELLPIETFRDFPAAAQHLDPTFQEKPVVMYCTGGVRCEKAAAVLLEQGFKEVYQLEGGILQYFIDCGKAHYQGECFVFDDREVVLV